MEKALKEENKVFKDLFITLLVFVLLWYLCPLIPIGIYTYMFVYNKDKYGNGYDYLANIGKGKQNRG